jgi:hypothetical protein
VRNGMETGNKRGKTVMLIIYAPAYCKVRGLSCEHGKYPECPQHETLLLHCQYAVKREELQNGQ